MAELRRAERSELLDKLTGYLLPFNGHEGYAKVSRHLIVSPVRLQSLSRDWITGASAAVKTA